LLSNSIIVISSVHLRLAHLKKFPRALKTCPKNRNNEGINGWRILSREKFLNCVISSGTRRKPHAKKGSLNQKNGRSIFLMKNLFHYWVEKMVKVNDDDEDHHHYHQDILSITTFHIVVLLILPPLTNN
jgi:hypothetical protein